MGIFKVNTIASKQERRAGGCSLERQLLLCGNNTGNVVFYDALDSEIVFDGSVDVEDIITKNEEGENVFVFPAANWINKDSAVLKAMFLPLEHTDIKVAVLGLGIQLSQQDSLKDFCDHIDADAKKALSIMSERSVSIGVRGEITAECLNYLGIRNVDVIGCPSFYSDGISAGHRTEKKMRFINEGKICFNIMPGCKHNAQLLLMGIQNQWLYMQQSKMDFPEFIRSRSDEKGKEDYIVRTYYEIPEVTLDSVHEYIMQYGRICWHNDMWRQVYREDDISFTFGNRFHGNMMSYLLGIPALWIEHDLRTKELIQLFRLPHMKFNEEKIKDIRKLKECCVYSEEFWKNREALFERYIYFLEKNCLKHYYE